MGTRHLIMVIDEAGETKIAQYAQWHGYPRGSGETVRKFLTTEPLDKFRERLTDCYWVTEEQIKQAYIDAGVEPDAPFVTMDIVERFDKILPYLSRDHGASILDEVLNSEGPVGLHDNTTFAADSLFCEWAYVIDFQKWTFEVYKGFNREPLPEWERFAHLPPSESGTDKYYPVKLVTKWDIGEVPDTWDSFIDSLNNHLPEEDQINA